MTRPENERIAAVEVEVRHLRAQHESTSRKVDEMHAILMQAKGARWAVLGLASIGGAIAGFASTWLPWFAKGGPG